LDGKGVSAIGAVFMENGMVESTGPVLAPQETTNNKIKVKHANCLITIIFLFVFNNTFSA
jgi:hypothetical protein